MRASRAPPGASSGTPAVRTPAAGGCRSWRRRPSGPRSRRWRGRWTMSGPARPRPARTRRGAARSSASWGGEGGADRAGDDVLPGPGDREGRVPGEPRPARRARCAVGAAQGAARRAGARRLPTSLAGLRAWWAAEATSVADRRPFLELWLARVEVVPVRRRGTPGSTSSGCGRCGGSSLTWESVLSSTQAPRWWRASDRASASGTRWSSCYAAEADSGGC